MKVLALSINSILIIFWNYYNFSLDTKRWSSSWLSFSFRMSFCRCKEMKLFSIERTSNRVEQGRSEFRATAESTVLLVYHYTTSKPDVYTHPLLLRTNSRSVLIWTSYGESDCRLSVNNFTANWTLNFPRSAVCYNFAYIREAVAGPGQPLS